VTVVIKRNDACAMEHYVTYQTSLGAPDPLPSTFDDGQTSFGPADAVRLNVRAVNRHVEITLRYIDTTIVLRHIGRHLSVAIAAPHDVIAANADSDVRGGGGASASMQLCRTGCPASQRISLVDFFARGNDDNDKRTSDILPSRRRDVTAEEPSPPMGSSSDEEASVVSVELALVQCRGLVDYFLDSCVFDVMTTGNSDFAVVAREVHADALRLCSSCSQLMRNRTTLLREADEHPTRANSALRLVERYSIFVTVIYTAVLVITRHVVVR